MTLITTAEATGLLDQWADEVLVDYDTGAEGKTVQAILEDWIALQTNSNPLTLGTIAPSIASETRAVAVQEGSMLQNLWALRQSVGGFIYVSTSRQLNWAASIGEDRGQWFHWRLNMPGIDRTIDYRTMVNKLYAYGAYTGDARIKLSDAEGQSEDYVEDATSQATYGIKVRAVTDRSMTHPDTLLAWANLHLADHKDPVYTYRVNVIMLSELDDSSVDWYALQLGSTVKVIDDDLGISVDLTVVSISQPDLDEPWDIEVELSNVVEDVADLLAEVYNAQELEQHAATRIGAGQVVISGIVTIEDWVSDGQTTINGAQITTGTVTADQIAASTITVTELDFTPVEAGGAAADVNAHSTTISGSKITTGTLTADRITTGTIGAATVTLNDVSSIIKSSNYAAGSAGWQIKGNGDAEFNDVTIRGTVYATAGEFAGTLKTTTIEAGKTLTVSGSISAASAKVVIDSTGVHIHEDFLNFLDSDTNYGGIYADHSNTRLSIVGSKSILIRSYDGDLNLETLGGLDNVVMNSDLLPSDDAAIMFGAYDKRWLGAYFASSVYCASVRPGVSGSGHVGWPSDYWGYVYADTYYGKNTTIQSFQKHDDIQMLKSIKNVNGKLDLDTFPAELLERDENMEAALRDVVAECEARRLNPAIPLAVAQEQNRWAMADAQKALSVRGVSILDWNSLLMGAILKLTERIEALELRLASG